MHISSIRLPVARPALLGLAFALAAGAAAAADAVKGIEQALVAAQQDKRGISIYVSGLQGLPTKSTSSLTCSRSLVLSEGVSRQTDCESTDGLDAP